MLFLIKILSIIVIICIILFFFKRLKRKKSLTNNFQIYNWMKMSREERDFLSAQENFKSKQRKKALIDASRDEYSKLKKKNKS